MGKLIYSMLASLDGYTEDVEGNFDWAAPDEEVHRFVNAVSAPVRTMLYGRRMYETMQYWETADQEADQPDVILDWARSWQAADKIVYSATLDAVSTARTRLEREFEPEAVRALKSRTEHDLDVSGPGLAAAALRAELVDEISVYLAPVIVGGGTPFLPVGLRLELELREEHRFTGGFVYLRYAVRH